MMISTNYAKKLVYSCIRPVRNKPRRPTEDELKLKISTDTLIGNLRNMLNTLKIHDANHYKWVANGSDKANSANAHIKIVKYIFSNFSEKCLINLLIPILASIYTPKIFPILQMYSSKKLKKKLKCPTCFNCTILMLLFIQLQILLIV